MKSRLKRTLSSKILFLVCLIPATFFCLLLLSNKSIWADEESSIYLAGNFFTNFQYLIHYEGNMILYYLILHFWLYLGSNEFIVRLLSVLFAVGTIPPLYILGKELFNKTVGIISTFIVSINILYIAYAQEARAYSLLLLLTTISSLLFTKILVKTSNKKIILFYILTNTLSLYTHLFTIFILIGQSTAIFFYPNRKKHFLILLGIQSLSIIGVVPLVLLSNKQSTALSWIEKPKLLTVVTFLYELAGNKFLAYIFLVLVLFLLINKRKKIFHKSSESWKVFYLLSLLLLPIICTFAVSVIWKPIFVTRYLISLLISYSLLFSLGITAISQKSLRIGIVLIIGVLSATSLYQYYFSLSYQKDDWRDTAKYIMSNYNESSPIIFYIPGAIMPFSYYANSYHKVYNAYQYQGIKTNLNRFNTTQLWLILNHNTLNSERITQTSLIEQSITKNYKLTKQISYTGIKIQFFTRIKNL